MFVHRGFEQNLKCPRAERWRFILWCCVERDCRHLTLETTPSKSQRCVHLRSLKQKKSISDKEHVIERGNCGKKKAASPFEQKNQIVSLSSMKCSGLVRQTSSRVRRLSKSKATRFKKQQPTTKGNNKPKAGTGSKSWWRNCTNLTKQYHGTNWLQNYHRYLSNCENDQFIGQQPKTVWRPPVEHFGLEPWLDSLWYDSKI